MNNKHIAFVVAGLWIFIIGMYVSYLIIFAEAFTTVEITAPSDLTYQNSTSVNISGGINITAFPYLSADSGSSDVNITRHTVNVTILTKTTSSGTYSILASSLPLTINASNDTVKNFWNYTATLPEGRNYIRLNFTNVSRNADGSYGGALTAERIVQIDTAPFLLNFSGKLHLENFNLSANSPDGTRWECGVNDTGQWGCN